MRLIAHRGLSSRAPENTLAAFELAAQEQSNWVEFDVMLTQDEEPIIIHDDTLERTTNGEGRVGDRSYAYIRTLNAGKKLFPNNPEYHREKVPHLSEVIAVLTYRNLNANIEIKPCFCTTQEASDKVAWDTAKQILALLKKSWPASKPLPLISSFNPICLSYFQQYAPEYNKAFLFEKWNPSQVHTAKELGCSICTTHYSELTEERVLKMKEAGLCVYSYTVDNIDDARRLRDWGVDAIFSNDPTKLALLLEEVCHTSLSL